MFVFSSEVIYFALVVAYSHEQLAVGLLTGEEFVHDLLHISQPSARPNLLEGVLYLVSTLHLLLHLLLQECTPHLLYHEVLLHLDLVGVLVLVCSCLCDLLLPRDPVHAPLQRLLLVADRLVQALYALLPVPLLLVDEVHQLLQLLLRLQTLLLRFTVLLTLLVHDSFLLFV